MNCSCSRTTVATTKFVEQVAIVSLDYVIHIHTHTIYTVTIYTVTIYTV